MQRSRRFWHLKTTSMIVARTQESVWLERLAELPPWTPPGVATLLVSPHPDDETLGAGGLIQILRQKGGPVSVAAVTDGERAYGDEPGQAEIREGEQTAALKLLGVEATGIFRLRLPDSGLRDCEARLVEELAVLADGCEHIVAPWVGDFHPDHEVCGRAAQAVALQKGIPLTSYFFWTWHRGDLTTLDGLALRRLALNEAQVQARWKALRCHGSQLEHHDGEPILPADLLGPMERRFEIFLPQ